MLQCLHRTLGWVGIRAAVAHLEGDQKTAIRHLERVEDQFTRFGMMLHVATRGVPGADSCSVAQRVR